VTGCTFEAIESTDIWAQVDFSAFFYIEDSHFDVGSGWGIWYESWEKEASGVMTGNTIVGDSAVSEAGITLTGSYEVRGVKVTGNTVTGFKTGDALAILGQGEPYIEANELVESKYGIHVVRTGPDTSEAIIGGWTASRGNEIADNTTGILCEGVRARPSMRYNDISDNANGVVTKYDAMPDLGVSGDNGNNSFTGSTIYCIWNRSSDDPEDAIPARGNYFGDCVGGEIPEYCAEGAVDLQGHLCSDPLAPSSVEFAVTRIPDGEGLRVRGTWPNPARSSTAVHFDVVGITTQIGMRVFDISGRLVAEVEESEVGPGRHHLHWSGRDRGGREVGSGIYFVQLTEKRSPVSTTKVVVVR
jgi:hypothetical protein